MSFFLVCVLGFYVPLFVYFWIKSDWIQIQNQVVDLGIDSFVLSRTECFIRNGLGDSILLSYNYDSLLTSKHPRGRHQVVIVGSGRQLESCVHLISVEWVSKLMSINLVWEGKSFLYLINWVNIKFSKQSRVTPSMFHEIATIFNSCVGNPFVVDYTTYIL